MKVTRERERVVHCLLVQSISQAICNDNECRGIGPKIIGQIGQSNTILLDAASLCPSSVKDCLLCSRSPIKAQQVKLQLECARVQFCRWSGLAVPTDEVSTIMTGESERN